MTDAAGGTVPAVARVTVRYWASARAAAGVECDEVEVGPDPTLADVLAAVRALHADRPRVAAVVAVCSVLVGDRPVGSTPPEQVRLTPGATVELLPPFAGG
jgi:molybdopterin converting factor small subunit